MKGNDKVEEITKIGRVIKGDGWILPNRLFRTVTLACGHVKALNSKRRLAVGDRKLCTICTDEDRAAGVYDMSRLVKQLHLEDEENFHVNPYEWHEIEEENL